MLVPPAPAALLHVLALHGVCLPDSFGLPMTCSRIGPDFGFPDPPLPVPRVEPLPFIMRTLDHPLLSIYVLKLSSLVLGTSDFALRLPYVLAGTATVAALARDCDRCCSACHKILPKSLSVCVQRRN